MTTTYKIGDKVEWRNLTRLTWYLEASGKWLPATVTDVVVEDAGYTWVFIKTYNNFDLRLSEPEVRHLLRHEGSKWVPEKGWVKS